MFLFVQYIYYFRSKKYSDIRMGLKPFSIYLAKILINIWAKVSFLLNHFWRENGWDGQLFKNLWLPSKIQFLFYYIYQIILFRFILSPLLFPTISQRESVQNNWKSQIVQKSIFSKEVVLTFLHKIFFGHFATGQFRQMAHISSWPWLRWKLFRKDN